MQAPPAVPLSGWAQRRLSQLAVIARSSELAALSAHDLVGERAALGKLRVPGSISAGGGCRFYRTADGHVALNLARAGDRDLLPALFGEALESDRSDAGIAPLFEGRREADIVSTGRELGLAIAGFHERASGAPAQIILEGGAIARLERPLVIDLTSLWAGPLAGQLLQLAGCEVIKIESPDRRDPLRNSDPAHFASLNGGKASVALSLRDEDGRHALLGLIERADIVIEASRPRALLQLGIDADALVRQRPGLVWVGITGHGIEGPAANWVAFGDDAGVAGGLSRAMFQATGRIAFVGDAIGDPLTGIAAAGVAIERYRSGRGGRIMLAMSAIVADALDWERTHDAAALAAAFTAWAVASGAPFPTVRRRTLGVVADFGADTQRIVGEATPC